MSLCVTSLSLWPIHTPTQPGKIRPPERMMLLSTVIRPVCVGGSSASISRLADPDAAGAQVVQAQWLDPAIAAAAAEPDAVDARVPDLAILERHVPGAVGHDRRRDADGGLAVAVSLRRQQVAAVPEGQSLERQVLDHAARLGLALDLEARIGHGGDDLGLGMSSPGSGM